MQRLHSVQTIIAVLFPRCDSFLEDAVAKGQMLTLIIVKESTFKRDSSTCKGVVFFRGRTKKKKSLAYEILSNYRVSEGWKGSLVGL